MTRKRETMTSVDNLIFQMDHPDNLLVITALLLFNERLDYRSLAQTLENRLLCHDRFRKRIIRPPLNIGRARWEIDPDFNLYDHLHRLALPSPGDKKTLEELVGDLTATPLDYSMPLWQMHYIENVEGNKSALFARIHHCMADGITLVRLLLGITDKKKKDGEFQPDSSDHEKSCDLKDSEPAIESPLGLIRENIDKAGRRAGHIAGIITREIEAGISNPEHFIERGQAAGGAVLDSFDFISRILLLPDDRKTILKKRLGTRKTVAWSDQLPLAQIKSIGNSFKGTVNDVLLALVTGALRRYLDEWMEPVDGLEIRMAVPVNLRGPDQEIEMGNQVSMVLIDLPVHIDDPAKRITEIRRRMKDLKEGREANAAYLLLNAASVIPTTLARKAAEMLSQKITGVMTNVPGPQQQLYLAGVEIENIMCWVPRIGDVGLGVSMISYNNSVCLGIITDTRSTPDPAAIIGHFTAEFKKLSDTVCQPGDK